MLISQLEAKLDSQLARITALETQILEVNKIIDDLKEYRNKMLSDKSDIYWEAEDTKEDIARLKEEYHICS